MICWRSTKRKLQEALERKDETIESLWARNNVLGSKVQSQAKLIAALSQDNLRLGRPR